MPFVTSSVLVPGNLEMMLTFSLASLFKDVCASPERPEWPVSPVCVHFGVAEDGGLQGLQHPAAWNLCKALRYSSDPPSCKGSAMQLPAW